MAMRAPRRAALRPASSPTRARIRGPIRSARRGSSTSAASRRSAACPRRAAPRRGADSRARPRRSRAAQAGCRRPGRSARLPASARRSVRCIAGADTDSVPVCSFHSLSPSASCTHSPRGCIAVAHALAAIARSARRYRCAPTARAGVATGGRQRDASRGEVGLELADRQRQHAAGARFQDAEGAGELRERRIAVGRRTRAGSARHSRARARRRLDERRRQANSQSRVFGKGAGKAQAIPAAGLSAFWLAHRRG